MPVIDLQPLALIVEDNTEVLEKRTELLEAKGFAVIGATSKQDAEKELRASPSIDLFMTDVNLDPTNINDKSGIDLAHQVQVINPELPRVGYSGHFEKGQLPQHELNVFNEYLLKGEQTPEVLKKHITSWRKWALEYRQNKIKRAGQEVKRLVKKYGISTYDFNLLREFIPGISKLPSAELPRSVEDVLRDAGYKLKIIEKGEIPPNLLTEGVNVQSPIPVWLLMTDDYVIVEVYRFPELYVSGETEEEAIRQLLLLMAGYHQDLSGEGDDSLSPLLIKLRNYLNIVFE